MRSPPAPLEDLLTDLLLRFDDARQTGRPVTPQQLCADTPHLLAPFTKLLKDLGRVDPVFDGAAVVAADQIEVIDAGRFDPISFQAEGGLGVVYLAEDAELKRAVALKWMKRLPGLDPVARRRFLQEAEITGKLEHPGIAPVYGAGRDPDGRPFYAMRFIQGDTLGDAIERFHAQPASDPTRPVEFARLLRSFISVCQTVAYAHVRGVIHRDLKPGNVMIGPYGETLVVDWGLAKRIDMPDPEETVDPGYAPVQLAAAGGGHTVYGQVKGSPAYMAPEQARGETNRVGPPADVYALGATLYAILTGRAPYTGKTATEIVEQVKHGPPPAPRAVVGGVPKPLDAVCRKAMSRNEDDRYATPLELAAEVERWLADEPVTAYRDPLLTRARRWVKRHRTAVATVLAALFVVGVALAVVVPLLAAKNRELTDKTEKLETANAHLAKANGDLATSNAARQVDFQAADTSLRAVMDSVFARATISEDPLTRKLRSQALRRYREYLGEFIARNATRDDLRLEVALAWLKVGEVDALTGKLDDGLTAYTEGERRFAALAAAAPQDRDLRFGLACAKLQRGGALNLKGRISDARPLLTAAREEFTALAADPTPLRIAAFTSVEGVLEDSPRVRLADTMLELTRVQYQADTAKSTAENPAGIARSKAAARTGLKIALDALTGGKPLPPSEPILHLLKAFGLRLMLATDDPTPAAVADVKRLLAEIAPMVKEHPMLVELQHLQLAAMRIAARTDLGGLPDDAAWVRLFEMEILGEKLVKSDHGLDHLGLKDDAVVSLAEVRCDMAEFPRRNAPHLIEHRLKQAVELLAGLAARDRVPVDTRMRGVLLCMRLGQLAALDRGTRAVSEQGYATALKLLAPLRADAPTDADLKLIELTLQLAMIAMRSGQRLPLGKEADAARTTLAELKRAGPDSDLLANCDVILANAEALELVERKNPAAAADRIRFALKRLTDGEKLGLPPMLVDCQRLGLEMQLAWLSVIPATWKLDEGPPDTAGAIRLYDRAISDIRTALAREIRTDPELSEKLKPLLDYTRDRVRKMIEVLENLKAAAKKM